MLGTVAELETRKLAYRIVGLGISTLSIMVVEAGVKRQIFDKRTLFGPYICGNNSSRAGGTG